jgi:hypothetical protein
MIKKTEKLKHNKTASSFTRNAVQCEEGHNEEETSRNLAQLVTSPAMSALRVVSAVEGKSISEKLDLPTLIEVLREQGEAIKRGDLSRAESMLIGQATALQAIFARLTERAMGNTEIAPFEANLKMALRAQSQCRATLETLAAIKNPPVVYAKQANVTTGPQQINNTVHMPSQAQEIQNAPNQLSGVTNELCTNTRASSIEGRANQQMETVGEIDRTKNQRRKKTVGNARLQGR